MAAGAVDYAQANLGVTVPSSQNSSLDQYAINQLQNAVANGRAAFAANSGAGNLVYSLGQMNIDAALFAASQITGPTATPLVKAFKPRSGGGSSQAEYQVCTVVATGKIALLPTGSPIPEVPGGMSCKDPDLYIPPPPCFPGQQPTPQVPCLQPDTQPLTPAQCRDLPGHRVNQDGTMCLPNPGQGCAKIANPLLGADPVCTPVPLTTSVDPNDKFGPFGPGAQHFHTSATSFNYNIEFQNQPTAPVPAQQVVVTDQLDTSNLDLTTFTLGPISFGSYTLSPPGGAQQFSGGLDLRPDQNLIVKVDAGLNQSTGLVTWRFTSLDPDTEQLTTNPVAGFLPPDLNPPQGEGKLLYSINPKAGIASSTTVCNQATVVFDTNAPINTRTWCNTVDDIAPHSGVGALPTIESGASFPVQWSGTDTGSGINDYTIYVSDNGGSYQAWLSDTTLTQSTYPGVLGHSYAFYSIASDMVGNVEAPKSAPDTVTTVRSGAPVCAADVTAQFNITRGGYRYNNGTHRFQQVVTITRTAAGLLAGPFALALEKLGANATLYNPAGTTSCIAPGSAYITVNPGPNWSAGQSVTVTLEFVDPTMTGIAYTPALLAGATR